MSRTPSSLDDIDRQWLENYVNNHSKKISDEGNQCIRSAWRQKKYRDRRNQELEELRSLAPAAGSAEDMLFPLITALQCYISLGGDVEMLDPVLRPELEKDIVIRSDVEMSVILNSKGLPYRRRTDT